GLFHHKKILTPSVHFTVDFLKPTRYGERLTFNLWAAKAGTASCELRIEASHQGEMRMRAKQVLVFMSAESARATPIPPELLSRIHRYTDDRAAPATIDHAATLIVHVTSDARAGAEISRPELVSDSRLWANQAPPCALSW